MKSNALVRVRNLVVVALSTSVPLHGVLAQEQAYIEEIVVSAEKREVSAQDTPISVSAISGQMLENSDMKGLDDVAAVLPNTHIGYRGNTIVMNVRGVETNISFNESANAAVAFNVDGVYLSSVRGGTDLFHDIERVEVLRGPQGTLAGRNATAGSINVITKRPEYEFGGSVELVYGSYDRIGTAGVINVPLVDDRLAIRASFISEKHDGYLINDRINPEIRNADDADNQAFRIGLLYQPSDDFTLFLKAYRQQFGGAGPQTVPFLVPAGFVGFWEGSGYELGFPTDLSVFQEDPSDPRVLSLDSQPVNDVEVQGLTAELNWNLGNTRLTYLGNYHVDDNKISLQDYDGDYLVGAPGSGFEGFHNMGTFGPYIHKVEQTSHELRLGSVGDSALNWVTGLYYFEQDQHANRMILILGQQDPTWEAAGFSINSFNVPVDATSYAAYADVKYRLSDQLELFGGLRYTDDEIHKFQERRRSFLALGGAIVEDLPLGPDGASVESDSTDWRAGFTWFASDRSMAYVNVSTGYKSAGTDGGSNPDGTYNEETVTAYEVGTKNTFFDGRFRLNGAVFFNDYDGIQLGTPREEDGVSRVAIDVIPAEVFGVELEGIALLGEATSVDFAVGYLDTEIGDFISCDENINPCGNIDDFNANSENLGGNRLPNSPELSLSLGLEHTFRLGEAGTLTPRLQTQYKDKRYLSHFNKHWSETDSYTRTNIFLTYRDRDERFFAQAFVKNLEDEDVINQISPLVVFLTHQYDAPRTWGIRLGYEF